MSLVMKEQVPNDDEIHMKEKSGNEINDGKDANTNLNNQGINSANAVNANSNGSSFISKIATFIQTSPLKFGLICAGIVAVVVVVVAVPVVVTKDDNKDTDNLPINLPDDDSSSNESTNPDIPDEDLNDDSNLDDSESQGEEPRNPETPTTTPEEPTTSESQSEEPTTSESQSEEPSTPTTDGKNILAEVDMNKVNTAYNSLPSRTSKSFSEFIESLKSKVSTLSLKDKAYLVYKWICDNIDYDVDKYYSGDNTSVTAEDVYLSGKGVCSGYSKLFTRLYTEIGGESFNIHGYDKGLGYTPGKAFTKTTHEWNAIKLDNYYYLIDATWGAGYVNSTDKKYYRSFDDFYFCTKPEILIRNHYPQESQIEFQLLPTPITIEKFGEQALMQKAFYKEGFTTVDPDLSIIEVNGKGKITLNYDSTKNIYMFAKISKLNGNTYYEQDNMGIVNKFDDHFELDFFLANVGEYKIELYGSNDPDAPTYDSLISYKVQTTTETTSNIMKYPKTFADYNKNTIQLLLPVNGEFQQGSQQTFKIKVKENKKCILIIGSEWIEMENTEENIYMEENVFIHSTTVSISIKEETSNPTLCKYLVTPITSGATINFPAVGGSCQNVRLFSPYISSLTQSSSYSFKVRSLEYPIYYIVGSSFVAISQKNNNIYEDNIIIPQGTELKISYENGTSYYPCYIYSIQ